MIWLRTLFLIALWAIAAFIAQWLIGDPAGWILFSAALAGMLVWRSWRLHLVSRWANNPDTSPPASVGPWDDILAPLYRYTRARARELAETQNTMHGMLAAAQALPDGAVTLNEDFQIDWCNRMARQHLGLRLPADRGHNLLNLLRAPEFVEYAHRASWPEPILVRLGQNGQERLMMMQLTAYASNQRLLITRDVTQIERLETTRRDFVANVSHELRTPLTVLAGFLETLRDMPADALPAEQREQYIDMMHEQAQRMQAIVEDLLTLSTLESSPGSDPRAVNISALLQKARQQIEALSGGRHVLEWHIDETLDVLGAETELASALSNLLTNAVRYTPDGGTITVRWEREADGGARYSVQDTGIGIPARHLPRLTERFYRVDRGRSRAVGGTGLGLAITKHIAMRHDAELLISSEQGKGSVFALRFPPDRVAVEAAA
ncbi:phosphate regulon sensor histidine kinase PhoR [Achromobacter denitrificans]|jgi:two-component system phosphate regulon sensor histidine kinase PhoR|uniref:Phosphate regulon sensor protein PhoR n=1 Tax=Achromobacter denitrificans TaxID=32002 RepID=A0ABZ3G0K2_ACHDE|nr:phosphate regulon sensor histidine kinase PhoR [Achromobacter denitrificans]MDX3882276.1 phosphate regulon sensor histidine kinase PhoR [Achromobacter sp.]ASC64241.1 phosphate regulon sensor histidine kinase PhoR [Achromobacter denitrificans]MDF3850475.1 phosphate regulon sensor histidine kinase PhoR [Achromobacter denitrificans]OLU06374.1 phosphate regulon sensor histidine kinase PhoR [Achromobacter denitrificans]QKH44650.1 phosphate regulon sensor histidine kinase PhoR [Achromobacter deni